MATIDYKQKIKDYINSSEVDTLYKSMLNNLFPELKESKVSEDERIRKAMIHFFFNTKNTLFEYWEGIPKSKVITWLEKQDKNNMGISEATKKKLEDNLNKALEKETPESWNKFLDEQKPAWSEEDVEIVETLNEYVKNLDTLFSEIKIGDKDILSKEFREKVQLWLNSLKNRVQPKQGWSEEDCNQIETIACHLDNIGNGAMAELLLNIMDKYKSLRHQTTWKPSELQIEALVSAIDVMIDNRGAGDKNTILLSGLYHELKTL